MIYLIFGQLRWQKPSLDRSHFHPTPKGVGFLVRETYKPKPPALSPY